ncbi:MAG: hypothetical protein AMS16_03395 [Planctomycetes bacterium DG_58]|nr:MAG: hypothetical protein AMS16_03395 [Planctomycetes bacterium DG_58]
MGSTRRRKIGDGRPVADNAEIVERKHRPLGYIVIRYYPKRIDPAGGIRELYVSGNQKISIQYVKGSPVEVERWFELLPLVDIPLETRVVIGDVYGLVVVKKHNRRYARSFLGRNDTIVCFVCGCNLEVQSQRNL